MKVSPDDLRRQYRIVFEALCESPRAHFKEIAPRIGTSEKFSRKRTREAFDLQRVVGPELRKDSYFNLKEYMYFVKSSNVKSLCFLLQNDPRVIYHMKMLGFCDLWVISKEKMDIEGDIVIEGVRSDYYMSKPPDHSWDDTMRIMREKVETFDPSFYTPKGYIQTHWNETVEWSEEDELLYQYFKFSLRKPLAPLLESGISGSTIYKWFEKLPQCCRIVTHYFPEGLSSYLTYLFMFETDYEDFIIDLFSELPTTSSYFKVSDNLFTFVKIPPPYLTSVDVQEPMRAKYIPLFTEDFVEKGIVKGEEYALAEYFWRKSL